MYQAPRVRPAEPVDADVIADIYTESILARDSTMDTEPFSREDVLILLQRLNDRECVRVVETGKGVQGWGIVKRYSDRPGYRVACETSVYLYRKVVRQGLGRRVQMELFEFARSVGFRHVVTKIWADNLGSIAFHKTCGFTMVGVQHEIGLVDGRRRDVAIMECILDA